MGKHANISPFKLYGVDSKSRLWFALKPTDEANWSEDAVQWSLLLVSYIVGLHYTHLDNDKLSVCSCGLRKSSVTACQQGIVLTIEGMRAMNVPHWIVVIAATATVVALVVFQIVLLANSGKPTLLIALHAFTCSRPAVDLRRGAGSGGDRPEHVVVLFTEDPYNPRTPLLSFCNAYSIFSSAEHCFRDCSGEPHDN